MAAAAAVAGDPAALMVLHDNGDPVTRLAVLRARLPEVDYWRLRRGDRTATTT